MQNSGGKREVIDLKLERQLCDMGLKPAGMIRNLDDEPLSQNSRLSIGMECLDRDLWDFHPALENLKKLGIKQARLQSGWAKTEKTKGNYNFAWLDEIIDDLVEIGIKPWLCLCYGNPIYALPDTKLNIGGLGHTPLDSGESMQAWLAYVEHVVRRYKGKITYYEVWNEPELDVFFPYGEQWPEKYIELVAATSKIIRSTDKNARIGACSSRNFGISSADTERVLKLGIGPHIDIFSWHGYRELPEQMTEKSRRAYRMLFDKYAPHVEIWQGESGIQSYNAPTSQGALSTIKVSEEIQAKWIARRIICDLADQNLKLISYFHLYDFTHFSHMHNYYYGILRREDYSRKPSFEVVQFLSFFCDRECYPDETAGLEIWPTSSSDLTRTDILACGNFAFKRGEHTLFAYWYPAEVSDEFNAQQVTLAYWGPDNLKFNNPVIIDVLSRRVYQMTVNSQGWVGNAPLCSYPMILCEYDAVERIIDRKILQH